MFWIFKLQHTKMFSFKLWNFNRSFALFEFRVFFTYSCELKNKISGSSTFCLVLWWWTWTTFPVWLNLQLNNWRHSFLQHANVIGVYAHFYYLSTSQAPFAHLAPWGYPIKSENVCKFINSIQYNVTCSEMSASIFFNNINCWANRLSLYLRKVHFIRCQ